MKKKIKQALIAEHLWYYIGLVRSIPSIIRWHRSGCRSPAPHSIKMRIVRYYLNHFRLSNFVETGTYVGETLGFIAETGVRCTSIELSTELFENACQRFKHRKNVKVLQGDSGLLLPDLIRKIETPTLFWLDGHYSAGITARGDIATPISLELEAILSHPVKSHVILIDDARDFTGKDSYPFLDNLLHKIRVDGNYSVEVTTDIIRLTPLRLQTN